MTIKANSLKSPRLTGWSTILVLGVHLALSHLPAQAQAQTPTQIVSAAPACNPQLQCCTAPPGSGTPACGSAAGNPLNILTGNKFQKEVDMPALPGVLGLELVRYYNSELAGLYGARSALGRGWRLSYDAQLVFSTTGAPIITYVAPDGTHTRYVKAPPQAANATVAANSSTSSLPMGSTLYVNGGQGELLAKPGQVGYILTQADKTLHNFNAAGKLTQILAPTGHAVSLQRDPRGQLLKVTDPQGRSLTLSYLTDTQAQAGDQYRGVQHIDSPVGRYSYRYGSPPPAGMSSAIDKVNLLANLAQADLPGPAGRLTTRTYHYEDPRWPTLLTGISLRGADSDKTLGKSLNKTFTDTSPTQRLVTWAYDAQGRAVLSVKGQPARLAMQDGPDGKPGVTPLQPMRLQEGTGIEQVTLQFKGRQADGTGLTVLTNSLGQDTFYTYQIINGQKYLSEVRGPGCASCGASNQRYTYNQQAQITSQSQLDANGGVRGTEFYEYDSIGRLVQTSAQNAVKKSANSFTQRGPQWQERYYYASAASRRPSRITRPSVVAGQDHQVSLSYNMLGQITQQTETGYSPLDEKGQVATTSAQASKIERSTTYTYQTINGRSVLTQIDGPLPNGPTNSPSDSDITRFDWDDKADYIAATTQPGGFKSSMRYDSAGRIVAVKNDQGFQTEFTFAANQLLQTSSSGPGWAKASVQSYRYDAQGRAIETGKGDPNEKTYRPQAVQAFDVADRLQWTASAIGVLQHNQYDTESRLISTGRYTNAFAQTQSWQYSKKDSSSNAITQWSDSAGRRANIDYDSEGKPVGYSDSTGRRIQLGATSVKQTAEATLSRNAKPVVRAELPASPTPQRGQQLVPQTNVTRLQDDFGRTVMWASAQHGRHEMAYDQANRLIAMQDAQGQRASYQYDATGRIIRQEIFAAQTATVSATTPAANSAADSATAPATTAITGQSASLTTQWHYRGRQLERIEHPTQSEFYRYDERGLISSRSVTIKGDKAEAETTASSSTVSITRYLHGDAGQLVATSLPDGSWLHYSRNGQGQLVSVVRSPVQSDWLRKLAPEQTIASGFERDMIGLKGYQSGNGVQSQWQRSPAGDLARIVHRQPQAAQQRLQANQADPANPAKPITLLGQTTQDTIERLLGITRAHAQTPTAPPSSPAGEANAKPPASKQAQPGALGLPGQAGAFFDERYLWSGLGQLMHSQRHQLATPNRPESSTLQLRSHAYDSAGQLIASVQQAGPQTGAPTQALPVSAATQTTSLTEPSAAPSQVWRYAYDGQQRRILAQDTTSQQELSAGTQRIAYDAQGRSQSAADSTAAPSAKNNQSPQTLLATPTVYTPNGQPSQAGNLRYQWDELGRLTSIGQGSSLLAKYHYDHRGLRNQKTVPANSTVSNIQSTHYWYSTDKQLLAESDASGQIKRQYIYLADMLLAVIDSPQGNADQQPRLTKRHLLSKEKLFAPDYIGLEAQMTAPEPQAVALWQDSQALISSYTAWLQSALDSSGSRPAERIAFIHSNHLGAPEAATNKQGQVIWQASYAPFGAVQAIKTELNEKGQSNKALNDKGQSSSNPNFTLNIRLPGQYFDLETGLHYNRQRYYNPQTGSYLSPDPLGKPDGPNAYAYVANNPLQYVDPDGLILFAFDGTGNTEASRTNVYWLSQAYNDNDTTLKPDGNPIADANRPYYVQGPGTGQIGDGALAFSLKGRIDRQLKSLDDYVKAKWTNEIDVQKNTYSKDKPLIITLDIVGFSRGAAAARDFTNQLIERKNRNYYNKELFGFGADDPRYNCVGIKVRFMGLFDTVLSTAIGDFNLGISNSQIEYVAHAVAVNEHRALFPLVSIEDSYGGGGFTAGRVEKGFIGAHSDIGGGYAASGGGDLSDVALNWMVAQATSAGVKLKPLEAAQTTVSNPILHDETRVAPWNLPGFGGFSSDRDMKFPDQTVKMKNAQIEGMTYSTSQSQDPKYITYDQNPSGSTVGTVDMEKYKVWLQSNLSLTIN